ncbi:MAG: hypothetical protein HYZ29_34645 [Myxococcales bacterium]|nr:hypothetical protein [Myxococcales bacterium]
MGVVAEVSIATAYAFRGLNVFQDQSQGDQHALFSPSLAYSPRNTSLTFGYAGFFQWTGRNRAELVENGVGHEQDFVMTYAAKAGSTSAAAALTYYAYPFASARAAGKAWPSYLEPAVTITWSTEVDVTLQLLYFHGVQSELAAGRYAYLHPTVGKTFELDRGTTLSAALGAGYKDFPDHNTEDNAWDVHFDWKLTFALGRGYLAPAVHLAWTNLASEAIGGETLVWAGFASGIGL